VAETVAGLEGHFPGFPVVPAVVQLQWVLEVAGEMAGRPLGLRRMEQVKFRALLRPGQVFRMTVALSPASDQLDFSLRVDDGARGRPFSSGRLVLDVLAETST
jgi:3-hydroxymyristoyl/3-hydroxydecanoyl-(acyl carrier protein) dehydratase